jgi:hypothetical protein
MNVFTIAVIAVIAVTMRAEVARRCAAAQKQKLGR